MTLAAEDFREHTDPGFACTYMSVSQETTTVPRWLTATKTPTEVGAKWR